MRTLQAWEEDGTDPTSWIRRDGIREVRVRVTHYEGVGAITDFFCGPHQPTAMVVPHGSSISVQQLWADKALREAGWTLLPVDRTAKTTTSGKEPSDPVPGAPEPINPDTGQHGAYYVLSEDERAKGYQRPVRLAYVHGACGAVTTMSRAIAETYARDPGFYGSTFCVACRDHFPVVEFLWDKTSQRVGS